MLSFSTSANRYNQRPTSNVNPQSFEEFCAEAKKNILSTEDAWQTVKLGVLGDVFSLPGYALGTALSMNYGMAGMGRLVRNLLSATTDECLTARFFTASSRAGGLTPENIGLEILQGLSSRAMVQGVLGVVFEVFIMPLPLRLVFLAGGMMCANLASESMIHAAFGVGEDPTEGRTGWGYALSFVNSLKTTLIGHARSRVLPVDQLGKALIEERYKEVSVPDKVKIPDKVKVSDKVEESDGVENFLRAIAEERSKNPSAIEGEFGVFGLGAAQAKPPITTRAAYVEQVKTLPGFEKLSPHQQKQVERIVGRLLPINEAIHLVRNGTYKSPTQGGGNQKKESRFEEDRDYVPWIIRDGLEDALVLAQIGNHTLATLKLNNLALATHYLSALGPSGITLLNRNLAPKIMADFGERTATLLVYAKHIATLSGGIFPDIDVKQIAFSPIEKQAFEALKQQVRVFANGLKGDSEQNVREALMAVGISRDEMQRYPALQIPMAFVCHDIEQNSESIRGKLFFTGQPIPRHFSLTNYAYSLAESMGFFPTAVLSPENKPIGYSSLKSTLFKLEFSRFLSAETLGLTNDQLEFEKKFQEGLTNQLTDSLVRIDQGIHGRLRNLWPASDTTIILPEDLFVVGIEDSKKITGYDFHIVGNGSQTYTSAHPLLGMLAQQYGSFSGSVLLLGSGEGDEIFGIGQRASSITAVDGSSIVTAKLQRWADRNIFHVRPTVVHRALEEGVAGLGQFNHVVSINAFDFVDASKQPALLRSIADSLLVKGKASIAVLHPSSNDLAKTHNVTPLGNNRFRIEAREGSPKISEIKRFMTTKDLGDIAARVGLNTDSKFKVTVREANVFLGQRNIRQLYSIIELERIF